MTTPAHKWETECKLWVDYKPGDQAADVGDYIVSTGGSAYLVLDARPMTRSARPNR